MVDEAGNVGLVLMVVRDSEETVSKKMFAALLAVSASANLPRR
jgi:hypothetical protein